MFKKYKKQLIKLVPMHEQESENLLQKFMPN